MWFAFGLRHAAYSPQRFCEIDSAAFRGLYRSRFDRLRLRRKNDSERTSFHLACAKQKRQQSDLVSREKMKNRRVIKNPAPVSTLMK
jgi:hypothetical protein